MFKIGILSNYNKKTTDIEPLSNNQCEVHYVERDIVLEHLATFDGVIMHYKNEGEKSQVYEQILTIRSTSRIPIWIMSEEMSSLDKLIFLKLGVFVMIKEYVFDEELSLTLSNTLHFFNPKPEGKRRNNLPKENNISKDITINARNLSLCFRNGQIIYLTNLEYRLFIELAKEPNKTILYDDLIEKIWPDNNKKDALYRLANLVFHLRKKLRNEQINPNIVKTVRSRGYMFSE